MFVNIIYIINSCVCTGLLCSSSSSCNLRYKAVKNQRMRTLTNLSFDLNAVSLGVLFGTGMAVLGAVADTLPIFKDITRDTRMFTLRLLGRDTSAISALGR